MNKKQRDQMQFSPKKGLEKTDLTPVNSSQRLMDCVIKWVIDSSILQEMFSSVSKCL